MMQVIGDVFIIVGAVLLVISAWGVIALPDALARQHAATKAGTFALALVCIGAIVFGFSVDWTWRLLLIVGFLMATLPVASHLLARAVVREDPDHNDIRNAQLIGDDPALRVVKKD